MKHVLKIWPDSYRKHIETTGSPKLTTVRKNDRNFKPRDEVVLRCWSPKIDPIDNAVVGGEFTEDPPLKYRIQRVDECVYLPSGYVILQLVDLVVLSIMEDEPDGI